MSATASLINGLSRLGRPRRWRRFCASFVVSFDFLVLFGPIVALAMRAKHGAVDTPFVTGALIAFGTMATAATLATLRLWGQRRDPMTAARDVDQLGQTKELFLTAADHVLAEKQSLFLPLLLERAQARLPVILKTQRPPLDIPLLAFKRDFLALLLTVLILMVPAFPQGLLGPRNDQAAAKENGQDDAAAQAAGQKTEDTDVLGFAGKVKVRVRSDQKLYYVGDEFVLIFEVETLEPIPGGVQLGALALVDGEVNLPLPVPDDQELSKVPGEKTEIRMAIRDRLKSIGRYRRGLLAIDPKLYAKTQEPGFNGPASGNRVVIQIAENAEKLRAKTPTSVKKQQKKKPKPKPRSKPKKKDHDKKPKNKKKPKKKPRQAPGKQPGSQPPAKIDAKPFVVEPLFSGNKTKKRKVRVFDRNKEKGATPPTSPQSRELKTRGYEAVEVPQLKKLKLGNSERRMVRKYFNGIRSTTPEKSKK